MWNVRVVMEAPTDSAAYTGNILDGKVEEYLFAELTKLNINRDYLHITSVVKCHVPKGTSMGVREIHKCSKTWLDREVEEVEPVLILLLGNTPLLWATGEDTGITRLNGTTIWNPKFDAWVSFCVSPASAYYTPENRPAFFKGIKSFAGALEALGGHLEPSTEPMERSGGGRQAGIASKNEILGKSGRSPEGMMARMRFAMRQLYYSAGRPVTADDAHQWAQRNGIDFPEKSYPAIWSKGWRKVGHTNSNRPEGHDAHLYTWEPGD
jgi:uracil-DNA glycosylase family 4